MYRKISLKRLSNKTLVKMLLRQLYLCYDLGGISMGRSHRSFLLEMAQFLTGKDRLTDINRDRKCFEFLNEAKIRISKYSNKKTKPTKKLELVKNYSLAYLLVKKLRDWIKSVKGTQEHLLGLVEKAMIETTLKLMEADGAGVSGFFYARELMKEASIRKNKICGALYTKRFHQGLFNWLK